MRTGGMLLAIGFKLVVLPKLSYTSPCFCRLAMPFKSFATLGTVLSNAENGTAMKPIDSLTKCPYWHIYRCSAILSPSVRSSFYAALCSGWCSALNASNALLGPSSFIKSRALIAFPPALQRCHSRQSLIPWPLCTLPPSFLPFRLLLHVVVCHFL